MKVYFHSIIPKKNSTVQSNNVTSDKLANKKDLQYQESNQKSTN
jgi:hypothetical protein